MKRMMRNNNEIVFELNIDIEWTKEALSKVAATDILPVGIDKANKIIDETAREGFVTFVGNLFEIIQAYDFVILDDYKHTSKSFPYTSQYMWIARQEQLENNDVPIFIHLRVSEHVQEFSDERNKQLKDEYKQQADNIKLPKSKKKQRFVIKSISVNDLGCKTYEEALHEVELEVRSWVTELHIDLEPYGPAIW